MTKKHEEPEQQTEIGENPEPVEITVEQAEKLAARELAGELYFMTGKDKQGRPRIRVGNKAWFKQALNEWCRRHKGHKIKVSEIRESSPGHA